MQRKIGTPMEPLANPELLKQIARQLQDHLKPQANVTPLQVQCGLKDRLMVLVQHPPGVAPDPQPIFSTLEQAIPNLPQNLLAPLLPAIEANGAKVRLFLRILGQSQPYSVHEFALPAMAISPDPDPVLSEPVLSEPVLSEPGSSIPVNPTATQTTATQTTATQTTATQTITAQSIRPKTKAQKPLQSKASPSQAALAPTTPAPLTLTRKQTATFNPKPWLIAGGGIAMVVLLGGAGYALTRPCVMGGCQALETAQVLGQESTQLWKAGASEQTSQQVQQKLVEARRLVSDIPAWSSHYGEAQTVQQTLDRVLMAQAKATLAAQKGQTTAQPVTEWQAVESLWREAIAQLEPIAQSDSFHPLAQERLATYRANLTFTNQRISAEQDAQQRLITAKKTSSLAESRQNTAQSPQEWQMAQVTWQVAVNALKQVPNGTTSHVEAQQLLESYGAKLGMVRDRATKEQLAQKTYAQVLNLEKQAKDFQRQNQWAQAAATWQAALNQAKQIPAGTSLANQAQTLVESYSTFAKQAGAVVKIRTELDQVCFASGKICDYTINDDAIKVNFTATYERKVRTVGGMSWFSGDVETMYKIDKHFASLGKALQAISTNSGMQIEVYNSDKQMVGAFSPGG